MTQMTLMTQSPLHAALVTIGSEIRRAMSASGLGRTVRGLSMRRRERR